MKLASRKFWFSVVSFALCVYVIISGIQLENDKLTIVGLVCAMLSAAIYGICESRVDGDAAMGLVEFDDEEEDEEE